MTPGTTRGTTQETATAGEVIASWEQLPFGTREQILGGARPLILAPHPDDESLGCGGLIAGCCGQGKPPLVVILTDGAASHPGSAQYPPARLAALRAAEAYAAVAQLGLGREHLRFLHQPDTALAVTEAAVAQLVAWAQEGNCGVIVGPWQADPHCDHEAGALLARSVASRTGCRLLAYPVWGWLLAGDTWLPHRVSAGWRLPIAEHLEAKGAAIRAHASQYGDLVPDSPEGFRLPEALLRIACRPYEVFLEP